MPPGTRAPSTASRCRTPQPVPAPDPPDIWARMADRYYILCWAIMTSQDVRCQTSAALIILAPFSYRLFSRYFTVLFRNSSSRATRAHLYAAIGPPFRPRAGTATDGGVPSSAEPRWGASHEQAAASRRASRSRIRVRAHRFPAQSVGRNVTTPTVSSAYANRVMSRVHVRSRSART